MINIKNFDSSLLKIDKKSHKKIGSYYIRYITIKNISDYENVNSVNPLFIIIGEVDGYIEENNENKYLTFASTDKNKKGLDNMKYLIKTIDGSKSVKYEIDFMRIKFNSDDDLPLNKILKLHNLKLIVRSASLKMKQQYTLFMGALKLICSDIS